MLNSLTLRAALVAGVIQMCGGGASGRAPAAFLVVPPPAGAPQARPCVGLATTTAPLARNGVVLAHLDSSAFCESQSKAAADLAARLARCLEAVAASAAPPPLVARTRPREVQGTGSAASFPMGNPFVASGVEPLVIMPLPSPSSVVAALRAAAPELTDQTRADDVADAVAGSSAVVSFTPLASPPRRAIAIPSPMEAPILPQVIERASVWNSMGRLVITDRDGAGRGALKAEEQRVIALAGIKPASAPGSRCVVAPAGPRTVVFADDAATTLARMRVGYVLADGVGARRDRGPDSPHVRASGESAYTVTFAPTPASGKADARAGVRRLPGANPVEGTGRFLPGERIVLDESMAAGGGGGFVALALAPESVPGAHSYLVIDRPDDLAAHRDRLWLVAVCETIDDTRLTELMRALFAGP